MSLIVMNVHVFVVTNIEQNLFLRTSWYYWAGKEVFTEIGILIGIDKNLFI